MTVLGTTIQFCTACKQRTIHTKILDQGVILFFCSRTHPDLEDVGAKARKQLELFVKGGDLKSPAA